MRAGKGLGGCKPQNLSLSSPFYLEPTLFLHSGHYDHGCMSGWSPAHSVPFGDKMLRQLTLFVFDVKDRKDMSDLRGVLWPPPFNGLVIVSIAVPKCGQPGALGMPALLYQLASQNSPIMS